MEPEILSDQYELDHMDGDWNIDPNIMAAFANKLAELSNKIYRGVPNRPEPLFDPDQSMVIKGPQGSTLIGFLKGTNTEQIVFEDRAETGYLLVESNPSSVVQYLVRNWGNKPIFYYSHSGLYRELIHIDGDFQKYGPSI